MSVYLVHGFRWTRRLVYEHIANYDVEDAAPEWVQTGSPSGDALRDSITHLYPDLMESLHSHDSDIIFIEQHGDEGEGTRRYKQPYVYVCDQVEELTGLCLDVGEVAGQWGLGDGPTERFSKLRDQLEAEAKIGLWVVLCSVDMKALSVLSRNSLAEEASVCSKNDDQPPPTPLKDGGRGPVQVPSFERSGGDLHKDYVIASDLSRARSVDHDKPLPTIPKDLTISAETPDSNPSTSKTDSPLSPLRSLFRLGRGQSGSNLEN